MKPLKAVALVSGGLDSRLAAQLVKELGIQLVILNFKTPFCLCDRHSSGGCGGGEAAVVARDLNLELKMVNVTEDFFKILKQPKHGYGSNINPCIDCRILMLSKAKELMLEIGASFVITGEVLGQRPMSQHRRALGLIEKEAGLQGLVLRPLSAKLLDKTIPEKEGWVCRDKLLGFCGRTRRPQIDLARQFNIKDYPCAAGGCLLTDKQFANRIRDLLKYQVLNLNDIELLKVGRHFRLTPQLKLVVGRDETENQRLLNLAEPEDYIFAPAQIAGATALARGEFSDSLIELCCKLTSRYCDLNGNPTAEINYGRVSDKSFQALNVSPLRQNLVIGLRI